MEDSREARNFSATRLVGEPFSRHSFGTYCLQGLKVGYVWGKGLGLVVQGIRVEGDYVTGVKGSGCRVGEPFSNHCMGTRCLQDVKVPVQD